MFTKKYIFFTFALFSATSQITAYIPENPESVEPGTEFSYPAQDDTKPS